VTDSPTYVVTVETPSDVEDLRNCPYAAANRQNYGTTERWDTPKQSGVAFHFKALGAALAFIAYCKQCQIPCRGDW
jgi:hypothetical protein